MKKESAYQEVKNARSKEKISIKEIIQGISPNFFELHGDKIEADDKTLIGGIGKIGDLPITIIAIQKGNDLEQNIEYNFGSARPQGYRKALRLMEQAEKFNRPILTLINTPGAWPDVESEYHGQGSAIAECIVQGLGVHVPYISIIVGEGGSGGALALACGDRVFMFKNSFYSVVSPEGYASIIWKDSSKVSQAAEELNLTPGKLLKDGIIDKVLSNYKNSDDLKELKDFLIKEFSDLKEMPVDKLMENRRNRFRKF
ncbi:carboxyltransferase subunit alpha [Companilactobacillus nuruki]|uniref:acetyl-CoA carboxytransferase n=1 Tax=Companilactobacillus nuruki TaxID=1993540 RepID=A0A2N7AWA0_9LACO|nr:carboxyltransferase subunit alpha [Companilactobacillus nuruki]PMD73030.1 acetyl-CoA carboxylase carboxyl transferase subunit alpha [Companilactobacillus nuruki]